MGTAVACRCSGGGTVTAPLAAGLLAASVLVFLAVLCLAVLCLAALAGRR